MASSPVDSAVPVISSGQAEMDGAEGKAVCVMIGSDVSSRVVPAPAGGSASSSLLDMLSTSNTSVGEEVITFCYIAYASASALTYQPSRSKSEPLLCSACR